MIVFISFIFLLAIGSGIFLMTNKSKEVEEIKSILQDMFLNLKKLFLNIKDLVVLLTNLIQDKIQEKSNLNSAEQETKQVVEQGQSTQLKKEPNSTPTGGRDEESQGPEASKGNEVVCQESQAEIDSCKNLDMPSESTNGENLCSSLAEESLNEKVEKDSQDLDVFTEVIDRKEDIAS